MSEMETSFFKITISNYSKHSAYHYCRYG